MKDLQRKSDGKFYYTNDQNEAEVYEELFPMEEWDSAEAFEYAGIKGYEPMTAKELDTEEAQDKCLNDTNYVLEEKFDGTRALVYFLDTEVDESDEKIGFCRVFSRRISKKTGFYVENTDSLPQIREINVPRLSGTIIDGEMFINGLPFKEVSSTLNCLWDKAVDRQIEKGFITFHAFDILFYKGVDLRKFPLWKRKEYLKTVVEIADSPYIELVDCYQCGDDTGVDTYEAILDRVGSDEDLFLELLESEGKDRYPHLYECWKNETNLTPRAFYELIVSTGGEGAMVKPKDGKYLHKRGWEYSKIKKFLTRDLILLGFDEPTREYTGKEKKTWGYWEETATGKKVQGNYYNKQGYEPVTKFYFNDQVGNLVLGVLITHEEYEQIPKAKRGEVIDWEDDKYIMQVCECSGFDDDTREYFTRNRKRLVYGVVEVKANEIFKDSGKLRHPRFMRQRPDKNLEQCTWQDHIM